MLSWTCFKFVVDDTTCVTISVIRWNTRPTACHFTFAMQSACACLSLSCLHVLLLYECLLWSVLSMECHMRFGIFYVYLKLRILKFLFIQSPLLCCLRNAVPMCKHWKSKKRVLFLEKNYLCETYLKFLKYCDRIPTNLNKTHWCFGELCLCINLPYRRSLRSKESYMKTTFFRLSGGFSWKSAQKLFRESVEQVWVSWKFP
jgi:hypothetical protein